jgi:hypothetical protein
MIACDVNQIPSTDHADRPPVLDDWNVMTSFFHEDLPDFSELLFWHSRVDAARHDFRDRGGAIARGHAEFSLWPTGSCHGDWVPRVLFPIAEHDMCQFEGSGPKS